MWPRGARDRGRSRAVLARADAATRPDDADVRDPRVRDRQDAARDRAPSIDLSPLEITTCLRRGELEIDVRYRPGAERAPRGAVSPGSASATSAFVFSPTARRSTSRSPALLARAADRRSAESCTAGLLAARLTDLPGRLGLPARAASSPTRTRRRPTCSASPPELIERHGAVSPEVAEAMADGALERFGADARRRDHRDRRPRRRHRGEAGRLRLLLRPARRRRRRIARDPVIPGDRADIRDRSCTLALHLLRRLLRGEDFPL